MKNLKPFLGILVFLVTASSGFSANIMWVSDLLTRGTAAAGPPPYPDDAFITLLTGAGHTVTRFNPDNSTPLTAPQIATLNASNLVILGRSIASAAFDPATAPAGSLPSAWNTSITAPILATNTFLTRSSRLGWFTGGPTQPAQIANMLTFPNLASPVSSYIIGSVPMAGNTTVNSVTEAATYPTAPPDTVGTALITDPPVAGATVIAFSTVGAANGNFIVSWPAGTAVRGGADVLAGYRLQFLAGNTEGTAPNNNIGSAGYENLTANGESMFLRAVTVALNKGAIPEPATATFILLAGSTLLRRRRRAA